MPWWRKKKEAETGEVVDLCRYASLSNDDVLKETESCIAGLSPMDVEIHQHMYGKNEFESKKPPGITKILLSNFKDPVTLLLFVLSIILYSTRDVTAGTLIFSMVLMSVALRFYQEYGANRAAERLRAMVKTKAVVIRNNKEIEIDFEQIAVGDIVKLAVGDLVPADVRIIESHELHVNQTVLTGESFPVPKNANPQETKEPITAENLCFLGTSIESGSATAVVIATGKNTYVGGMMKRLSTNNEDTEFDRGMRGFMLMIVRFIIVMVPLVLLLNGFLKGDWFEAFLFALAVAVGLTPDMLPMIITVNLTKGARMMAKRKVIVKRTGAIQNFGAMDVLCTDKTGTLTRGQIVLERFLDLEGKESSKVLQNAYLNSAFQSGFRDSMDDAIIRRSQKEGALKLKEEYQKIDELPFDFVRKRLGVVIKQQKKKEHILICKGAVDQVLSVCTAVEHKGKVERITPKEKARILDMTKQLNEQGFRVLALAHKTIKSVKKDYTTKDECELTITGLLAFLDPPKESAHQAIAELREYGVDVKILTGDSEFVTKKICNDVGLEVKGVLLGSEIDALTDAQLSQLVEKTTIFARLAPLHKEKIITALRANDHVVGFMGDGINDAPALKIADVSISVDTAVDIAKESSDIILLEQSLIVLKDGVVEGRRTFNNIVKYLKMATSSSFGNMFSVLGASIFLPFLPMTPLQVLTNNMLYDISQVPIPTDNVDAEYLKKPRKWNIKAIEKFVIWMGPISSIFDFVTFGALIYLLDAWNAPPLFQTGWFISSILTQTLVIHVLRTEKIPFIQSRASMWVSLASILVVGAAIWLVYSPFAPALGFVPLPPIYWFYVMLIVIAYAVLAHFMVKWFAKKYQL